MENIIIIVLVVLIILVVLTRSKPKLKPGTKSIVLTHKGVEESLTFKVLDKYSFLPKDALQKIIRETPQLIFHKIDANQADRIKDEFRLSGTDVEIYEWSKGSSGVVLKKANDDKLFSVQLIRELSVKGMKDAKLLTENLPAPLVQGISVEEATYIKRKLELFDFDVEIAETKEVPRSMEIKKDGYALILTHHGNNLIDAIKTVRVVTGYGLKEAKDLTETPNAILMVCETLEEAEEKKTELENVGCTVEIMKQ